MRNTGREEADHSSDPGPHLGGPGREAARRIRQALLEARRAGPIDGAFSPLDDSDLEAPLDADSGSHVDGNVPSVEGYVIGREVGSGGQAVVFEATQESTGRRVAVKVLPGGQFTRSRHRQRFDRETAILAALDHPGIIGILDRGRTADGSFYLVMPYVDGPTLAEYVGRCRRETPGDLLPVLRVFARVADAVGEAHRRGVVHRDLKPSNVLVDARGEPHVLDFGLARAFDPGGGEGIRGARTVTAQGQILGSLPWASPEQVEGAGGVGVRSDVYSLGVMLYEAVAGRPPYPTGGSTRAAMDAIQRTVPSPPTRTAGRRGGPGDLALDAIVLKALAKRPQDRYESAGALADDLQDHLAGRGVRVAAPGRVGRNRRIAAGLLAAVLAGGGTWWARTRPSWFSRSSPAATTGDVAVAKLPGVENSAGIRLVRVPAGSFLMGSSAFEPGHDANEAQRMVTLTKPVWVGVTEVTRAQYRTVMGYVPAASEDATDDLPVAGVSWDDAIEFCRRLNLRERDHGPLTYRLPTGAEWEYACRAGTIGTFAGTGSLKDMGWYADNSGGHLHPVATKTPNHWGLFDMHGNVEEWCADAYQVDPAKRRLARGGSVVQPGTECRSACPVGLAPHRPRPYTGFRVVADAD